MFFQHFSHSYFLGKFRPIIWISSNWLKFNRGVHCYMLNTVSIFIFSKFFPFKFFGQIWYQNLKFFKLIEIWYSGRLLYVYFDFDVYFFKIFVIHIFWAILVLKSEVLQINWHLVLANTLKSIFQALQNQFVLALGAISHSD